MCGEREVCPRPDVLGEVGQGREDAVHHGADEAGVVEVVPQLVHPGHRQPLRLQRGQRLRQVLAVLAAAGVRGVGAGGEHGDPAVAVRDHLAEGVGEVRGPVAVAPVHRQFEAVVREVLAQRLQKRTVLCVDRAHAAEEEVVLADFLSRSSGMPRRASRSRGTGRRRPGLRDHRRTAGEGRRRERDHADRTCTRSCHPPPTTRHPPSAGVRCHPPPVSCVSHSYT